MRFHKIMRLFFLRRFWFRLRFLERACVLELIFPLGVIHNGLGPIKIVLELALLFILWLFAFLLVGHILRSPFDCLSE